MKGEHAVYNGASVLSFFFTIFDVFLRSRHTLMDAALSKQVHVSNLANFIGDINKGI